MSTSSNETLVVFLNDLTTQINRYFGIFIFILGTTGNIFNCLILSQRTLRRNSCAFLFLASSIANLICIISGLINRFTSTWTSNLLNTVQWICKFQAFLIYISRTAAFWFLVLATIDRWLLSSSKAHYRQMSTLKNTKRCILIIILLTIIGHIHILYCYTANLLNSPLKCYGKTIECRLTTDLIYTILTILFPIIFMFIFGLKTVFNMRQAHNRIQPMNIKCANNNLTTIDPINRLQRKNLDQHLLIMLFIQIILLMFCTIPQVIQKLYSTITTNYTKSLLQIAIENLAYNLTLLLVYLASALPFYIYTLIGENIFRKEFIKLIQKIKIKLYS